MRNDFQEIQTSPSQTGRIVQWDDKKGFGWIESGTTRVFVHVKDFKRGQRRPKAGENVRFLPGLDPKGRKAAKLVTFVTSGERAGSGGWLQLAALLVMPGLALSSVPGPWWMAAGAIGIVSAVTYQMYAHDKERARSGRWRISEGSLHLAELLGGWPGAFVAQKRLRHKCSKSSYQIVFWGIVGIFQLAAADVITNQRLSGALMKILDR